MKVNSNHVWLVSSSVFTLRKLQKLNRFMLPLPCPKLLSHFHVFKSVTISSLLGPLAKIKCKSLTIMEMENPFLDTEILPFKNEMQNP